MNARGALALAVLVVVAGCAAPSTADAGVATAPSTTDARSTPGPSPSTATPSPDDGVLGWENGYWYDDPIDVNLSDGLSEAERGPYLARAMARVEHLRGHEFTRPIALDAVTPDRLRERINETGSFLSDEALSEREIRVMNVFWEALFFVDESTDARFVRSSESSAFLGAYYRSGTDTIRVVTRRPDAPIVGERLLIHELVHALQDEYADMPLETNSDDDNYATAALVEGDAELVERMYAERCEAGEWACVAPPPRTGGSDGAPDVHRGFRILRLFAYSDGPAFVYDLYRDGRGGRSGWAAVDRAFEIRPRTTEEIIHPERYPMETPAQPRSSVAPRNGWERLGGPYTVGEVEVFGMFWYQRHGYGNWIIDTSRFYRPDRERYDWYNYTSPPSEGWDGDALTVYARDGEHAYVWVTRWDSRADAEEFHGAYLELLEGHGATRSGPGNDTWVVPAGGYADAFHVELDGVRVRIVNAPSVRHLDDVDPSIG